MFQKSQNDEYLKLCIERVRHMDLDWPEQALDLIEEDFGQSAGNLSINDIGCNVGQFFKALARRHPVFEYRGYDVEEIYLNAFNEVFPQIGQRIQVLDIESQVPSSADITVVSATLAHINSLRPGLDHLLSSTQKAVYLRDYFGTSGDMRLRWKEGAEQAYPCNQYSFDEVTQIFSEFGFKSKVVVDRFTLSKPLDLGNGLERSLYWIVGNKL